MVKDLTIGVHAGLPVWPGDPSVTLSRLSHLEDGDSATVHHLTLSTHTGTHVDAPAHFVVGAPGVVDVPWEGLVGPAVIMDTGEAPVVTAKVLDALGSTLSRQRIVLFKTRNSHLNFWAHTEFRRDFTALDLSAAEWLLAHDIRGVGIDYLSIEPFGSRATGHAVHFCLLQAGVAVIEGLDLRGVGPGSGRFTCLPLKLRDAEGAPARAIWEI